MEPISMAGLRHTYRRYAPVYDWIFGPTLEGGRRRMSTIIRDCGAKTLLEVGVGTGLALRRYPSDARIVGIDVSIEMLRRAQQRVGEMEGMQVELAAMDAERLGFRDGSFDCVTVPYVLSATPNPERLIAELQRVCRPGGLIVLLNHFSGAGRWRWAERMLRTFAVHIGFRSEFDFHDNVGRHGLNIESVRSVNILGLSKLVVIRNSPAPRLADEAVTEVPSAGNAA